MKNLNNQQDLDNAAAASAEGPARLRPAALKCRGYTLLEVMVALLIVSMFLGVVFQNLSFSKKSSIRSEKAYTAVRLANNIFHDIETINRVVRGEIIEQKISGRENWSYRFSSQPLVLEGLSDDERALEMEPLKKMTLCIMYGRDQEKQSFCFVKWRNP